jgi:hypothetical protein
MQAFVASPGLPSAPGQLIPGKTKAAHRPSKIPGTGESLSPSTSGKSRFPADPLASTGSAAALIKARSQKEPPPISNTSVSASVAATISKAKEALAQARARAAAGHGLASGHSSRLVDGAVSDKPFTLYGKVELPPPRPHVQIHPSDAGEAARRK